MNEQISIQEQAYLEGFAAKCAEYGVDPQALMNKRAYLLSELAGLFAVPIAAGAGSGLGSRDSDLGTGGKMLAGLTGLGAGLGAGVGTIPLGQALGKSAPGSLSNKLSQMMRTNGGNRAALLASILTALGVGYGTSKLISKPKPKSRWTT